MRTRVLAVASEPDVAEAAMSVLHGAKGNAVDAVIAGVFAAGAMSPAVLLGPVQLLVGGAGAGLRAIDGRGRQPGLGVARPRGFTTADPILPASRVAVPALPAALATALASFGRSTLAQVLAPAVDRSRAVAERFQFFKRLAQRGPSVFAEHAIASELIAAAGRVAGGLLTEEDLSRVRPSADACAIHTVGTRRVATAPWGAAGVRGEAEGGKLSAAVVQVIAAADAHGVLAIACYEAPDDGVPIPELGLVAPFGAAPVLRGEARVPPGAPRPAASPIALSELGGVVDAAVGVAQSEDAERTLAAILLTIAAGNAVDDAEAPSMGRAVGVVRGHEGGLRAWPFVVGLR